MPEPHDVWLRDLLGAIGDEVRLGGAAGIGAAFARGLAPDDIDVAWPGA